jgi:hypothetical protein
MSNNSLGLLGHGIELDPAGMFVFRHPVLEVGGGHPTVRFPYNLNTTERAGGKQNGDESRPH